MGKKGSGSGIQSGGSSWAKKITQSLLTHSFGGHSLFSEQKLVVCGCSTILSYVSSKLVRCDLLFFLYF